MTLLALIEAIRTAFSEVQFPGEGDLTNSFGDEAEALVRDFCCRTDWQALSPEFLNQAPVKGEALRFRFSRDVRCNFILRRTSLRILKGC